MVQESNFNHDLKQEQIIGRYLDKIYPSRFPQGSLLRVADINQQKAGIDLIYSEKTSSNTTKSYIDEKAQAEYINQTLPTFAFELTYLFLGNLTKGWLFDDAKLTHYYFLVTSIFLKNGKEKLVHEDEIKSCLMTKVHRASLITSLSNSVITNPDSVELLEEYKGKKLTKDICEDIAKKLRTFVNNENKIIRLRLNYDMKVVYSGHKKEKPINIVIYLRYIMRSVPRSVQNKFETTPSGEVHKVDI